MSSVVIARITPLIAVAVFSLLLGLAQDPQGLPKAFIDGTGPGWRALLKEDFTNVNCSPETWSWKDGLISCTGEPIGVIRTQQTVTNFELVVEWRHLRSGGNSGVFVWASEEGLKDLKPG